jgi:hypothetical protein
MKNLSIHYVLAEGLGALQGEAGVIGSHPVRSNDLDGLPALEGHAWRA